MTLKTELPVIVASKTSFDQFAAVNPQDARIQRAALSAQRAFSTSFENVNQALWTARSFYITNASTINRIALTALAVAGLGVGLAVGVGAPLMPVIVGSALLATLGTTNALAVHESKEKKSETPALIAQSTFPTSDSHLEEKSLLKKVSDIFALREVPISLTIPSPKEDQSLESLDASIAEQLAKDLARQARLHVICEHESTEIHAKDAHELTEASKSSLAVMQKHLSEDAMRFILDVSSQTIGNTIYHARNRAIFNLPTHDLIPLSMLVGSYHGDHPTFVDYTTPSCVRIAHVLTHKELRCPPHSFSSKFETSLKNLREEFPSILVTYNLDSTTPLPTLSPVKAVLLTKEQSQTAKDSTPADMIAFFDSLSSKRSASPEEEVSSSTTTVSLGTASPIPSEN